MPPDPRRWRPAGAGAALAALALTAAACFAVPVPGTAGPVAGLTGAPVGAARPPAAATAPAPAGLARSAPTRVRIDSVGADSVTAPGGGMTALGLNPDRTVEVPARTDPLRAGWYRYAPTPGEVGTAVVLGHIDGGGEPGVFARLQDAAVGDVVEVTRADGAGGPRGLRFRVYRAANVDKATFPSLDVYGQANRPELRIISCGGDYDPAARSYEQNVILWAALES